MRSKKGLVLLVISFSLFGCNKEGGDVGAEEILSQNFFNLDVDLDEYASIKQFSDRSRERKEAGFKAFVERYNMASYLMENDLKENKEVRLQLAEIFQKKIIEHHFGDYVTKNISDEMAKQYYEEHKTEFIDSEYETTVISLRNGPSSLNAESELTKRALDISGQIKAGVDLGEIDGVLISNLILKASNAEAKALEQLKSINVGELTIPIKTRTGIKLYRLDSKTELNVSLEELMPKIRYRLEQNIKKTENTPLRRYFL